MFAYAFLAVTVIGATVVARPVNDLTKLNIDKMENKTLCPFIIRREQLPAGSIPKEIKHISCVQKEERPFSTIEPHIPTNKCSSRHHGMNCVQLIDSLKVYKEQDKTWDAVSVDVGCVCAPPISSLASGVRGP